MASREASRHSGCTVQDASELTPTDLLRRLENVLRPGTIAAVDHAAARVRVASGDLLTGWLAWLESRAGNVRTWCPPSVGEQCLVLAPGGDLAAGWVLVGSASEGHPAPSASASLHRTQYPDGTVVDYDHAAHALTVTLAPGGSASLTADQIHITGAVEISGPVAITGASLTHNGINVGSTHTHGGITAGPANTGGPQ